MLMDARPVQSGCAIGHPGRAVERRRRGLALARCITDVSRALRSWTQRELRAKSERVDSVTRLGQSGARWRRRRKVVARTEKIERVAKSLLFMSRCTVL